ncbi:MAG: transglutaminase family protein [Clostridiaceae bacterium]
MEGKKNHILFITVILLNVYFIIYATKIGLNIVGFDYIYFNIILIFSIIFILFYYHFLSKDRYRFILDIILITSLIFFAYIRGDINIKMIVDSIIRINYLSINNKPIKFSDIRFILTIIIPSIIYLSYNLYLKGINNVILIITTFFYGFLYYSNLKTNIIYLFPVFVFILILTFSINSLLKNINKFKNQNLHLNVYYFRFISIFIIVSLAFPYFLNKYSYPEKDRFSYYVSKIQSFIDGPSPDIKDVYDISKSGYTKDNGKLGGPVILDDGKAFLVKSYGTCYLRGSAYDTYNDSAWTSSEKELVDLKEMDLSLNKFIYRKETLTITPKMFNTSTLFSPLLTYNIDANKEKVFQNNYNIFVNSYVNTKSYKVDYYISKNNIDLFNNIEQYQEYLDNYGKYNYYNGKSNNYLQIPFNMDPKAFNILFRLLADCNNNFEKVEKIKKYLNENYEYNLDVEEIGTSEDLFNKFFTEDKEGYCVYFATATTILCRMAGIPARYVEGFRVDGEKNKKGEYVVLNSDAHAWTEVKLFGDNEFWTIVDSVPGNIVNEETNEEVSKNKNDNNIIVSNEAEKNNTGIKEKNIKVKKECSRNLLIMFVLLIGIYIIIKTIYSMVYKARLLKKDGNILLYKYYLKVLKYEKIEKFKNETDLEYLKKIQDEQLKDKMDILINAVNKEYYGKRIECLDKNNFIEFINKYAKKNGIIKYYIFKFFIY